MIHQHWLNLAFGIAFFYIGTKIAALNSTTETETNSEKDDNN